jgi:hypothetical protein
MLIATITVSGQVSNLIYDNQILSFDGYLKPLNDEANTKKLIKALGIMVSVLPVQLDIVEALSKYKNVRVEYVNIIPEFENQLEVLI